MAPKHTPKKQGNKLVATKSTPAAASSARRPSSDSLSQSSGASSPIVSPHLDPAELPAQTILTHSLDVQTPEVIELTTHSEALATLEAQHSVALAEIQGSFDEAKVELEQLRQRPTVDVVTTLQTQNTVLESAKQALEVELIELRQRPTREEHDVALQTGQQRAIAISNLEDQLAQASAEIARIKGESELLNERHQQELLELRVERDQAVAAAREITAELAAKQTELDAARTELADLRQNQGIFHQFGMRGVQQNVPAPTDVHIQDNVMRLIGRM